MGIQIRYGMVGGHMNAFIGEVHRKAIAFDPRAQLVAGCFSTNAEKNRETGETYSLDMSRVYPSYEAMAEAESRRPDGIDFVSITTPNNTHYAVAKCFLQHGIHVVCEKPLCFTVEQAQELVALAKEKNLVFGVTYTYSGYTMMKVAREMIAEGKIGKIAAVNAEYVQEWLIDELGVPGEGTTKLSVWRADPAVSGISNCVGDIGTHIENSVHYLTGLNIKRLAATVNRYGKELDLNANMLVEYENGVNGAYWCSQIAAGKLNGLTIRIYGSEGALEWEQHYPDYLKYTPKGNGDPVPRYRLYHREGRRVQPYPLRPPRGTDRRLCQHLQEHHQRHSGGEGGRYGQRRLFRLSHRHRRPQRREVHSRGHRLRSQGLCLGGAVRTRYRRTLSVSIKNF